MSLIKITFIIIIIMFHRFLHKWLMSAVMRTQLLIYFIQQMRCAKTIIMSVLLRDKTYIRTTIAN